MKGFKPLPDGKFEITCCSEEITFIAELPKEGAIRYQCSKCQLLYLATSKGVKVQGTPEELAADGLDSEDALVLAESLDKGTLVEITV